MRQNHGERRSLDFVAVMVAACGWIAAGVATAQTFTVLHSFTTADGASPKADLVQASDGYLYGTTSSGGDGGLGTVFRIDTSGNLTTLHSFGGDDGANPAAGLIEASDGFLYGTTKWGGTGGDGTVFRIDTSGNLAPLHSFVGEDGANPIADLVEGNDGFLYGTTMLGGTSENCGSGGCGTIFRIDTAGNLTTLHNFVDREDGAWPSAGLIQAAGSDLYGTGMGEPDNDIGNVFRIDLSGNLTVLHSFNGFDGSQPVAPLVQGSDGYFYGTTSYGPFPDEGGTVFRIDSSGTFSPRHTFSDADGIHPRAGLVQAENGYLYGTASEGGSGGNGTIFRINGSGTFLVVHAFSGTDGRSPTAGLVQASDGNFYGTAEQGGASGQGVVFRLEDCVVNPPPVITPSGPTTFCEGGSVTLDAGSGYAAYLWSPGGETTQTILVTTTGVFSVAVTSAAGCQDVAPNVGVTVVPNPVPVITVAQCVPANTSGLTASVPNVFGDTYTWTLTGGTILSGQGTHLIHFASGDPGTAMTLSVEQTHPPGCVGSASAALQVAPSPVIAVTRCLTPDTPGFEASAPFVAGDAYAWTITGGTIDSGQGTSAVTFTTAGPGTRVTLSVEQTTASGCNGTGVETMQVDFSDVPPENPFHSSVCVIGRDGVTAGHPDGSYGVADDVTRAQMAVFLVKADDRGFVPPSCTGIFADVECSPTPAFAVDWIEWLYVEGVTAGCGAGSGLHYCPDQPVSRAQMAVLLLKAAHGPGYAPPACAGIFEDVPCSPDPGFAVDWIEELYHEGVTAGCQADPLLYCPAASVTRGQMAALLVRTFHLP